VFEIKMLRGFAPERQKVTGGCKKLTCEEFHDLYCATNTIRATKLSKLRRRDMWRAWGNKKYT